MLSPITWTTLSIHPNLNDYLCVQIWKKMLKISVTDQCRAILQFAIAHTTKENPIELNGIIHLSKCLSVGTGTT